MPNQQFTLNTAVCNWKVGKEIGISTKKFNKLLWIHLLLLLLFSRLAAFSLKEFSQSQYLK